MKRRCHILLVLAFCGALSTAHAQEPSPTATIDGQWLTGEGDGGFEGLISVSNGTLTWREVSPGAPAWPMEYLAELSTGAQHMFRMQDGVEVMEFHWLLSSENRGWLFPSGQDDLLHTLRVVETPASLLGEWLIGQSGGAGLRTHSVQRRPMSCVGSRRRIRWSSR